jgi:pimeloyl-ACP methyl ester carboxylesterase
MMVTNSPPSHYTCRPIMRFGARRVLGAAAAGFDLAVRRAMLASPGGIKRANTLRHEVRVSLLARLAKRYTKTGAGEHFFADAPDIVPAEDVRAVRDDGSRVIDVFWPSNYRTFLPEVQEEYDRYTENRTATARIVVHREPRPILILIHGYLGGMHRAERRVWPMRFWDRLGMDVALFVLPFHGRRAERAFGTKPPFPGADPRITNEGFRQAMRDLQAFVGWLDRRGHPKIGVMGMSLGGFSTSLAATLESRLAFAVPIIPLASIAATARQNGHLGTTPEEEEAQYRALDAVYRVTSPLHRDPVIPPERMMIVAAEADRITPIAHARNLADHFGCRLETMPGGHLMQFGRGERFRSIGRFLTELGVVGADAVHRQTK